MPDPIPYSLESNENIDPKSPEITYDPDVVRQKVEAHRALEGKVIYEIGFGGRFCVNLPKNALSVGVDPMRGMSEADLEDIAELEDRPGSERLVFNNKIDVLPRHIYPDVVVMVAPSPESYKEMLEELEYFVGFKTQFLIALERQSDQGSRSGVIRSMIRNISSWLEDQGCRVHVDDESDDLGEIFGDQLSEVGIDTGGVLNTEPWLPEGEWATVLGTR